MRMAVLGLLVALALAGCANAGNTVAVGQTAKIWRNHGLGTLPVATTYDHLVLAVKAVQEKNDDRLYRMVEAGDVFNVDEGTQVTVLEYYQGTAKIPTVRARIHSGEHYWEEIWVLADWVKPLNAR